MTKTAESKQSAINKVRYAVQTGKLTRRPCEVCGAEPAVAHHEDYSQPLEVVWLCRGDHAWVHSEGGSLADLRGDWS